MTEASVHCARLFAAAALWVTATSPLLAQAVQQLSLAEAVRLAQSRNPLPQGAEARVAGARARLQAAGALPNPALTLQHGIGQGTGGLDEDVVVTQTIELGGKRRQRVRGARAERDAAVADRAGTALDVSFAVQSAYYEALRADVERQLASDTVERARTFLRAAETQFQAGDVPRSNVVRSQIELARAEQALAAAETDRANRYATLRSLVGLPEEATPVLTDRLEFTPVPYRLADLQALALRGRPTLQAAALLRDARRAAVGEVRSRSRPDLFFEGRRTRLDPSPTGSTLRVGITAPLFDLGRNRGDRKAAEAALTEQEAVLKEAQRVAALEVENAFRTLEQTRQAVESFRGGRLDRDRQLLEMAQLGYEQGANSYIELIDAQQVFRTEQAEYARALAAHNIAAADLQRAVGGKLP